MRIKETKVYTFAELSDQAKETARAWYRQAWSDDNEWSDTVIDECTDIAKALGVAEPEFYWRGFSSQGDGACMVGTWYASEFNAKKLEDYQDKDMLAIVAQFASFVKRFPAASFTSAHRGLYCHEHSVTIDVHLGTDADECDITDPKAEEEIAELARDFMSYVYTRLEAEYEWRDADEQVDENITANDYEFTEDGTRA